MIDHLGTVERLVAKLNAALPIPAGVTPELQASLGRQTGGMVPAQRAVTWITYMGDEGGIVCKLDLGSDAGKEAFTSITHLALRPAHAPGARNHRLSEAPRQTPPASAVLIDQNAKRSSKMLGAIDATLTIWRQ